MTQASHPADPVSDFPWPLTFESFAFGTRAYNTLDCSIIFSNKQFASDRERNRPSGEPAAANWKDDWTAWFNILTDMMPPGPVEVEWTSLDGVEHYVEIDLIKDVFPDRVVAHAVPKEDVNENWARYEGGRTSAPDILMEINDRTINIYMSVRVLTKLPPDPSRPDIVGRRDLVLAWTKNY